MDCFINDYYIYGFGVIGLIICPIMVYRLDRRMILKYRFLKPLLELTRLCFAVIFYSMVDIAG